jgi:hypothetical protein
MPVKFANNAKTTTAQAISAADAQVLVAASAPFPALGVGDYFYATIATGPNDQEIVRVTALDESVATIVRAQEGTAAQEWPSGAAFELRLTTQSLLDALAERLGTEEAAASAVKLTTPRNIAGHLFDGTADIILSGADVGLGAVENKSSETIRSELTGSDVEGALGFTPANQAHNHDDRYGQLSGADFATLKVGGVDVEVAGHTHSIANVDGLTAALEGKQPSGDYALSSHDHAGVYSLVAHNHDAAYAPISHGHAIADVTGLQGALDEKAADSAVVKLTGAQTVAGVKTFSNGISINGQTLSGLTAAGKALAEAASVAAQRTALGLGTIATRDKATTAQVHAMSADVAPTMDEIGNALAFVTATYGSTTTIDMSAGVNFRCTLTGNISTLTLSNVLVGKTIEVELIGNSATARSAAFHSNFAGVDIPAPTDITSTKSYAYTIKAQTETRWNVIGRRSL